jgi:hypothetical protein
MDETYLTGLPLGVTARADGYVLSPVALEELKAAYSRPDARGVVIEFMGGYWHGYTNDDRMNEIVKKTAAELFQKTNERCKILSESGYIVFYVWEKDWNVWCKYRKHVDWANTNMIKMVRYYNPEIGLQNNLIYAG